MEFPELVRSGVIDLMTGSGPLHAAARGGCAEAVKAVLDAGADIEARDGNGWTALRVPSLPEGIPMSTVLASTLPCSENGIVLDKQSHLCSTAPKDDL